MEVSIIKRVSAIFLLFQIILVLFLLHNHLFSNDLQSTRQSNINEVPE